MLDITVFFPSIPISAVDYGLQFLQDDRKIQIQLSLFFKFYLTIPEINVFKKHKVHHHISFSSGYMRIMKSGCWIAIQLS